MPLAPRCETLLLVTIALCGSSAFAALALSPTRGSSPALYPPMAPKIFYAGSHGNGKRRAPPSAAQAPVQHAALGRPTSSMRRSRSKSYFNLFGERPSVISGPLFRAARAPPGKPGAAAGSNDFGGIDVDGFGDDDGDERDPLSPSSAGPSSAGAPFNSPPFSSYSKRSKSYSAVRAQRELNWIEAGVQSLRRFLGRIPIIGGAFCMDAADDESSAVRGENLNFNLPPCECGDACPHALDDDYKPAALIWCTDCRKQMCPTCDDVAHSPYAVLHAREVHTPLADHPEQLDCYQFIEEVSGETVVRDYLPTTRIPVCGKCGDHPVLEVSTDRQRIPIWTKHGLMHKAKPYLRCPRCSHKEVLSPALSATWLGCVPPTPVFANVLFTTSLVQDFVESPLSAVTFAGRLNALSLHRSDLPLCDPEHLRECEREHLRLQAQLRSFARLPDTNFSCPICRDDCRVICVDGIFKLWQHASAAESGAGLKPVAFPAPGDVGALYESPERVSAVLATLDKHCTKLRKTCGSAQIDAMAGKTHPNRQIMAVTGTYCACCKHGILLKAFDFKEGEKASYPLAMYLLCQQRADVLVGDSLCRCNKFFERAASNSDEIAEGLPEGMRMFDPSGVQLKVNAMHVQGHDFACRVLNSIRNAVGAGLCHGEHLEQVFAAFKSIAPFVHNMMPCRRIDRITRTAYESNVNWLARMALLVLTDVLSAPLQLKRLEHRVLTLGSHLGFNFARGGVLDPKWCASPELAASNANVVAKLKKDVEVDGYVSDGLCSPADQLRISQMCHTIEFGCIFTILDKAPGPSSKGVAERRAIFLKSVSASAAKKLATLADIVPDAVLADWGVQGTNLRDEVDACLLGDFPWRRNDAQRALGDRFKYELQLFLFSNKWMRTMEEQHRGPADLHQLAASTALDVRRQEATVSCCLAAAASALSIPSPQQGLHLLEPELLSPLVQETLTRCVVTKDQAYGAVEAAKGGLNHYLEYHARSLAAIDVLNAHEQGTLKLGSRRPSKVRAQVHKEMRPYLLAHRARFGLKVASSSGVPSAFVKADVSAFARGGLAPEAAAVDDDDEANVATFGMPADCEPDDWDSDDESVADGEWDSEEPGDDEELPRASTGAADTSLPPARQYRARPGVSIMDRLQYNNLVEFCADDEDDNVAREEPVLFERPGGFLPGDEEHARADGLQHIFPEPLPSGCEEALSKARELLAGTPQAQAYLIAHAAEPVVTPPLFAMRRSPPSPLRGASVRTLLPGVWLDDEVINGVVLRLRDDPLCAGVIVCQTFVWTKLWGKYEDKREPPLLEMAESLLTGISRGLWRAPADLFANKRVLFPINTNNATHWTAGCIDFERKRIEYIDGFFSRSKGELQCQRMKRMLCALHLKLRGKPLDLSDWTVRVWRAGEHVPAQKDGHSCGLILICNLISLAYGLPMFMGLAEATREDRPDLNNRLRTELLAGLIVGRHFLAPSAAPSPAPPGA